MLLGKLLELAALEGSCSYLSAKVIKAG